MMRIPKNDVIAVIVDVQERLFPFIFEHQQLAENIVKLLKGLQILEVPIRATQQYSKGLGATIPQIRETIEAFQALEKLTFSCYGAADFVNILHSARKNFVILMGIEAHICVLQTALDLLENGFQPVVVEDCVSSRKLNDKQVAIERLRSAGVIITTLESVLFELCQVAGSEQFKAISKLVK
jgi:nicotinamidase-related amidase